MKYLEVWGNRLIVLSAFLFAVAMPTSMALDNVAAGLGILGFLLLSVSSSLKPLPPIKPLTFFLVPELIRYLTSSPLKIFKKTDFNHHLISYFVSYRVAKDRKTFDKVIKVLLVSTIALCFSVIFEAFTHQNIKHVNWDTLTFHTEILRAKGFLNHALTTGGVLFLLIVFFSAIYFYERRRLYLLPLPFLVFSLLLNESRSYWLAFLTFLLLLSLFNLRSNRRLVLTSAVAILLTGALVSQIPVLKERLYSIVDTRNNGSNVIRLALWKSHISAFINDYSMTEKIFGAGDKASRLAWKYYRSSFQEITGKAKELPERKLERLFFGGETHNIYLKFLTKYGILGLLGYLSFWVFLLYRNLIQLRQVGNSLFIKAFVSGYMGFMLAGFFENNFTDAEVQFLLLFVLGINLSLIEEDKNLKRVEVG